jgi:hypothetical protein
MLQASKCHQFLLFGDSIIQQSGDQKRGFGFAPALQNGTRTEGSARRSFHLYIQMGMSSS